VKGYGTYGPVPVRCGSVVTALFDERVLKELDVGSMPREEETGVMNLSFTLMEREVDGEEVGRTSGFRSMCAYTISAISLMSRGLDRGDETDHHRKNFGS